MLSFTLGQSHIKRLQLLSFKHFYKASSDHPIKEPEPVANQGVKSSE